MFILYVREINMESEITIPLQDLIQLIGSDSPTWFDYASLSVSLLLGILSLSLAYILFQLSQKYETKATGALEDISSLSLEVKQKVELGLLSQSDMSNKMLDKILENNYGETTENIKDTSTAESELIIQRISKLFETKLSDIQKSESSIDLDKFKSEIMAEIQEKKNKLSKVVSNALYRKLSKYRDLPAFYVLLDSIVRRSLTSLDSVQEIQLKEVIPLGFESGIRKLIEEDILVGEIESFTVNSEFLDELELFFDINKETIKDLRRSYSEREAHNTELPPSDKENDLAKLIRF